MHILIADDDAHLRQGLLILLERAGYRCTSVADGAAALAAIPALQPDLCLLDVMMPPLSGFELCAHMRQRGHYQPIILLTAFDEDLDRVDGFRQGADDYLTKPFRSAELLARIDALLRRQQYLHQQLQQRQHPSANAEFRLGTIQVDVARMHICHGNTCVAISARELKFLQLLHQSQGEVLSKNTLLDHCWGRCYLPSSRVLDQFIAVLRKKIEKELQGPRIIDTVYGSGYRLHPDYAC